MQVNNKKIDFNGGKFHKKQQILVISKSWKNQNTVGKNNEYKIITLNIQILQLYHVKEKYYEIKQKLFDQYIVDNCYE